MHYGAIPEQRYSLEMMNMFIGWAFLVDGEGRVRWKAHGSASDVEIQTLKRLVLELISEGK